jgi:DUF1680 family protein
LILNEPEMNVAFHCFHKIVLLSIVMLLLVACTAEQPKEAAQVQREKTQGIQPVSFNEVSLEDDFWQPRLRTQRNTLVPFALEKTRPAVENLRKTAQYLRGDSSEMPFPHRYISSDLYKVMEGAAYLLQHERDPALEQKMDEIIDIIAAAQKEDGYLYVAHITGVSKNHDHWGGAGMGDMPYSWVLHSHELYNMGHMYEAAIAYYRATDKDQWLKVAEKNAQHINRVFFEGDPNYNDGKPVMQAPGHQELELALTKLYRVTDNPLYLEMAQKFLDIRGKTFVPEGDGVMAPTYAQQHLPVAEQREAVGHAVRAAYQYSAMAEVEALKGTTDYREALDSIWHNIVDTKMHITGGLGAVKGIEGFGPKYVLPNKEAYNETCAAVGNVFFNHRMFLLSGDARYLDVAEVALFNNALAGTNLEGNRFFYVNPLEADGVTEFNHGQAGRSPWFNTACCPSNLARLMPQVSGMMYAVENEDIYLTLYAGSSTQLTLPDGAVDIQQETAYPFDGTVKIRLNPEKSQEFRLQLRIPTWAQGEQFVPGKLYHFANEDAAEWQLSVNGERVEAEMEKGFAVVDRTWQFGDEVLLELPMPIRYNRAVEQVENNRGQVAITRGPLVYCAEGVDNELPLQEYQLKRFPEAAEEEIFSEGLLKKVVNVAISVAEGRKLKLIPYYAWNNRGDTAMRVWFPVEE